MSGWGFGGGGGGGGGGGVGVGAGDGTGVGRGDGVGRFNLGINLNAGGFGVGGGGGKEEGDGTTACSRFARSSLLRADTARVCLMKSMASPKEGSGSVIVIGGVASCGSCVRAAWVRAEKRVCGVSMCLRV
jgi:hypothetical protein